MTFAQHLSRLRPWFARLAAACLCVVLAGPLPALAQSTGTLSGRVTDAFTKRALAGARVSLNGQETYTDATGAYTLANVTFLDSEATYPTRPGEDVPFIGQSDTTGNLGLTYEKGPLFLRLALNFRSERLREDEPLGGEAWQDLYVDDFKQLDLTVRYQVTKQFEVFAEFLNLTNEPFRVFLQSDNGQGARLGQLEEYDWSANVGVRWRL